MKPITIAVLLILSFQSSLTAQEITLKPSQLESALCKRWTVEFAKMGEMKIERIAGATDFDLHFDPDGTYELIRQDNQENQKGTWTYDTDNNRVELEASGNVKFQVKSITKKQLVITLDLGENTPPGMTKLELHLKPS